MKYGKLGNSGTVVSKLALGTMYFGEENTEEESFAILDAFLEAGGTLIDTADVYAENVAEQIIGKWFASRPKDVTDRVVLTSKGRQGDPEDENGVGLSRRHLHRALDASLQRLGRETIDLYQLHASDMETPIEETVSFLADAISAGKIHYYGLSNFTGWELQLLVSTAKAMGAPLPVTLQPQYSLLSRRVEWEILPAARHNNVGILPWSPLAGGFLSGKYERGTAPAAGTRAGSDNPLYQWSSEDYAESDRNWATIDAVKQIAGSLGVPPSQVALRWLLGRPGVTAPIFGARTLKQLEDNLPAVDLELDEATTARLDEVSAPVPGGYPYDGFGTWQRKRWLKDGTPAPKPAHTDGSDHPLGHKPAA